MGLPQFDVRVGPDGITVAIDGAPVPHVQAIRVETALGGVPRVLIEAAGTVDVEGVGVVEATDDDRNELDRILSAIDPKTLDRKVLDGAGLGDTGTPGEAYLAAVRGYVRGD